MLECALCLDHGDHGRHERIEPQVHLRQLQLHQVLRLALEAAQEAANEFLLVLRSLLDIIDKELTQKWYQFENLLDKLLSELGIVSVDQRAQDLLV